VHFSHLIDNPILIEESICASEDSGQNVYWEAGHTAAGREDDANQPMSTPSDEAPPVDLDMDNLDTERGTLSVNDPREIPLYEIEVSPCFVTSPRTAILPLCAGPAEPQEESPEPNREDNGDTIVVECGTSDGGSESSDDSDDENYVEEPPRLAKRRRVRFSDTVRYAPDGSQETPMSPADTLDNESQGTAESRSDMAYVAEEIPVSGVLTLKEVDGKMQYCPTFSQDLLPCFLGREQNDTSCALTSARSVRSVLPSVQGRGRASRGRYKFEDEDDLLLKQLKEEGKSWNEIAKRFPGTTKGSLQVRYSTKLKDRLEPPKHRKRRRAK
jgi:hypothetical protein